MTVVFFLMSCIPTRMEVLPAGRGRVVVGGLESVPRYEE